MDSTAFIRFIVEWRDFFIATATAAATLVGLLFVGLSLNLDEVMAPNRPDLRALAEQAFSSFTYVLLVSLFFLVPEQDPRSLGAEVGTLGVLGLLRVGARLVRGLSHPGERQWGLRWMARRLGLPALAYVGLLVVAFGLTQLEPDAMSILVTVMFVLLTSAAASAWDQLVRVSEDKRLRTAALVPALAPAPPGPADPAEAGEAGEATQAAAATKAGAAAGGRSPSDVDRAPGHDVKAPAEPEVVGSGIKVDPGGG
jgi:modulator of FtsH protease